MSPRRRVSAAHRRRISAAPRCSVHAEQRRAIAELLAGLAPEEWDRPSLCAGRRIREVATHVAVVPDPPLLGGPARPRCRRVNAVP
ncbi:maleylpyruvate isomerase N-terminal domain-containing protein [Nocardia sp. NPDC050697]|uniref:maleylpyruvate isomerase N-terminal domain-containing protein n=1 Tax=Nocardia sp. NPDC050697 TaxID=3155158 RepID=UPI0033F39E21